LAPLSDQLLSVFIVLQCLLFSAFYDLHLIEESNASIEVPKIPCNLMRDRYVGRKRESPILQIVRQRVYVRATGGV
jgi:hypothetical protein